MSDNYFPLSSFETTTRRRNHQIYIDLDGPELQQHTEIHDTSLDNCSTFDREPLISNISNISALILSPASQLWGSTQVIIFAGLNLPNVINSETEKSSSKLLGIMSIITRVERYHF